MHNLPKSSFFRPLGRQTGMSGRGSRDPGGLVMKNWKTLASAAREVRRNTKYGERERSISRLAQDKDINTIRRTIAVFEFLDSLTASSPQLAQALDTVPFSLLQILARWAEMDPKSAMKTAHKVLAGEYSVRSLRSALEAARRANEGPVRNKRLVPSKLFLDAIGELLDGRVTSKPRHPPAILGRRPIDMELRLERAGASPRRVAVLTVGPFTDPRLYAKRRHETLLRALGVAWLFDDVVLALPEPIAAEPYRQWLADVQGIVKSSAARDGRPNVHVLSTRHCTAKARGAGK